LAATASGAYFSVPSSESAEYLILYQNSAGVAAEVKRYAATQAVLGYYEVGTSGKTKASPYILSTSDTTLGWWDITTSYLFQDRFGVSPVTATGQNVGLIVPRNGVRGAEIITNGGFSSATGWTVPAGWAVGSGVATATATSNALRWVVTLLASRHYVVEFDAVVTSGTMSVALGAGTGVTISASGHYKLYLLVGGAPTG